MGKNLFEQGFIDEYESEPDFDTNAFIPSKSTHAVSFTSNNTGAESRSIQEVVQAAIRSHYDLGAPAVPSMPSNISIDDAPLFNPTGSASTGVSNMPARTALMYNAWVKQKHQMRDQQQERERQLQQEIDQERRCRRCGRMGHKGTDIKYDGTPKVRRNMSRSRR